MKRVCVICDEYPSKTNPAWQCPNHFDHVACLDCLRRSVKGRVEQGYAVMRCPCGFMCSHVFQDDELLPLLPPKTIEHLENLRLLQSSPRAVRCPECGSVSEGDPKQPQMECSKCKVQFCFTHGVDHPPGKCPRRRTPFRPLGRAKTWLWKKWWTRKCDKCGFRIERNGGCPHITCRCGHEFCWYCKSSKAHHVWRVYPSPNEVFEDSVCNHWTAWVCRIAGLPFVLTFGVVLASVVVVAFLPWKVFKRIQGSKGRLHRRCEPDLRVEPQYQRAHVEILGNVLVSHV